MIIEDTTEPSCVDKDPQHISVKPRRRLIEDRSAPSVVADGHFQRSAAKAEAEVHRQVGPQASARVSLVSRPARPKSAGGLKEPERGGIVRLDALALDTAEAWERRALGRERRGAAHSPAAHPGARPVVLDLPPLRAASDDAYPVQ